MRKFPRRICVTQDQNSDDENNLLAWPSIHVAESGKVAIYELIEVLEKRDVAEIRREGTKGWFKPA